MHGVILLAMDFVPYIGPTWAPTCPENTTS